MKKVHRSFAKRWAALVLSALLPACGTEPFGQAAPTAAGAGGQGGTSTAEAATSTSVSSTVAATAASSSSGPTTTACSVHVVNSLDAGVGGIVVATHDASGAIVAVDTTGVDGLAAVEVPEGGSASAYVPRESLEEAHRIVTFFDPPAGAVLHVPWYGPPAAPSGLAPTTYKLVAQGSPVGSTTWSFWSSCQSVIGSVKTSAVVTNGGCEALLAQDFLVAAYAADGTLLAWGKAGAPVSPGLVYDVVVPVSQTDLSVLEWKLEDLPVGSTDASIQVVGTARPSDRFALALASPGSTFLGSAALANLPLGRQVTLSAKVASFWNGEAFFAFSQWSSGLPATVSISADVLARVATIDLDAPDLARPILHWTMDPGSRGDAGVVFLPWTLGDVWFEWFAHFPSDHAPAVQLPETPTEALGFSPSGLVDYQRIDLVYEAREPGDYREAVEAGADASDGTLATSLRTLVP
jgi:hypothetical protein